MLRWIFCSPNLPTCAGRRLDGENNQEAAGQRIAELLDLLPLLEVVPVAHLLGAAYRTACRYDLPAYDAALVRTLRLPQLPRTPYLDSFLDSLT